MLDEVPEGPFASGGQFFGFDRNFEFDLSRIQAFERRDQGSILGFLERCGVGNGHGKANRSLQDQPGEFRSAQRYSWHNRPGRRGTGRNKRLEAQVSRANRSCILYTITLSLHLTMVEQSDMRIPVTPGIRRFGAGKTLVLARESTNVRAQIVGWSLIATLIALVAMTINCYAHIA